MERNPKKNRRVLGRVVWGVVALAIVAMLVVALLPKPIPVEATKVTRGKLTVTVNEAARTRVKDRYVVSAPLAGNLGRIELSPGDRVKAGDVIARISPADAPLLDTRTRTESEARVAGAIAAQKQAAAAVARAELAASHAASELGTAKDLAAKGAVVAKSVEDAELEQRVRVEELASAKFAAQVADHEVAMTRAALARFGGKGGEQFEITAPTSGRVLRVVQKSAGVVAPGAPLLEIGDDAALEVVSDVLTSDAVRIPTGAKAHLLRWGGDPLAGHVRAIEPSAFTRVSALGVEEQRATVVIDLDEPHEKWAALGDGYRLDVEIVTWERADVLVLPQGAAFRSGEGWAAFAIEDGKAVERRVELGHRSTFDAELLSGLGEGATIVLHPSEKLASGVRVASK
jgi:HlyD family secretion protein